MRRSRVERNSLFVRKT